MRIFADRSILLNLFFSSGEVNKESHNSSKAYKHQGQVHMA